MSRYGAGGRRGSRNLTRLDVESLVEQEDQEGVNVLADAGGVSYGDYLQLDKLLSAQEPQSRIHGNLIDQTAKQSNKYK